MFNTAIPHNARVVPILAVGTFPQPIRPARSGVCCGSCCLQDVCLPCGLSAANVSELDALATLKRKVARGAALYRSSDVFDALYAVRSGAFKTQSVSRGGVEKITGFHLPGELMGLDAINTERHNYDAMALEDSEVCVIPFAKLQALALRIPELQRQLFRLLSREIARDEGLMLLLGSMTAEQRLAAFLLSLSRRYQRLGYAGDCFNLRMTRDDIGNYLGLTMETVSRLMSRFQREGLIAAQHREIEFRNAAGLMELVGQW